MRDNRTSCLSLLLDTLPSVAMFSALFGSILLSLMTNEHLICSTGILITASCLSLIFGFCNNQCRSRMIETRNEKTGDVTYKDTAGTNWISILPSIAVGGFFSIQWFIILSTLHCSTYPVYIAFAIWLAWSFCSSLAFPIQYVVTRRGIWMRCGTIHSFIHFEDLERIYQESGFQLVWPSDRSNPIVRFNDYVVIVVKADRKLPKESQLKHLTPSRPLEFMRHLPAHLIRRL